MAQHVLNFTLVLDVPRECLCQRRGSPRARAAAREGGAEARGPAPRDVGSTTAPRSRRPYSRCSDAYACQRLDIRYLRRRAYLGTPRKSLHSAAALGVAPPATWQCKFGRPFACTSSMCAAAVDRHEPLTLRCACRGRRAACLLLPMVADYSMTPPAHDSSAHDPSESIDVRLQALSSCAGATTMRLARVAPGASEAGTPTVPPGGGRGDARGRRFSRVR